MQPDRLVAPGHAACQHSILTGVLHINMGMNHAEVLMILTIGVIFLCASVWGWRQIHADRE